jgi:hypothetical protein
MTAGLGMVVVAFAGLVLGYSYVVANAPVQTTMTLVESTFEQTATTTATSILPLTQISTNFLTTTEVSYATSTFRTSNTITETTSVVQTVTSDETITTSVVGPLLNQSLLGNQIEIIPNGNTELTLPTSGNWNLPYAGFLTVSWTSSNPVQMYYYAPHGGAYELLPSYFASSFSGILPITSGNTFLYLESDFSGGTTVAITIVYGYR